MYTKLNTHAREIRLLSLDPGAWNDTIECHLLSVSLEDALIFNALLYVWGSPRMERLTMVNGQPFATMTNIFTGLQRIRDSKSILHLWIDAVRINQADTRERGQQVELMVNIYNSAEECQTPKEQSDIYQWAGDDSDMELMDAYFERQLSLDRTVNDHGEDILGALVFLRPRADSHHLKDMSFFDADGDKLRPRDSWPAWTRIWVVQETVLAAKATLMFSYITVPWDMLASAARISHTHDQFCCENSLNTLSLEEETTIVRQRRIISREATDTRDKVYGLLGLVTNWQKRAPLVPDFSLNPKEVFIQATLSLMGTTRTDIPSLPSRESRINRTELFRAAGYNVCNVERTKDILKVRGSNPIDTVSRFGPAMLGETSTQSGVLRVIDEWYRVADMESKKNVTYAGKQSWQEAFWRTIANDGIEWHPSERTKLERLSPGIVRSVFRRLQGSEVLGWPEEWWSWVHSQLPDSEKGRFDASDCRPFLEANLDHIRLFHQSLLGATALRPSSILTGDVIVIILGRDTPFALRRKVMQGVTKTKLVGDVYIHGLMDGEDLAVDWRESSVQIPLS
ncbi:hypothetical protein EK21DRAFT_102715 [Setomelanomma holmii]|uniref:Heterokaryon incompatibility domain-containing protein n=1 Tax=Setomelanomma holmii TaxID=210430 RepID=A0A9P4LKL8_9PLEO|nr:hypothetical protein EK21DRAFT_102715 [Setomelanomma holmii]